MKYKGMNENTIRKMLQSNETALLQKGVTDMLNTITNTADNLLSSFSIEKFFSNKNFSDLTNFVKDILKHVENLGNKASNANIVNTALEKSITDYMKQINVNTKKTSDSVNKITTKKQSDTQNLKDNDSQSTSMFDGILDSISTLKNIGLEKFNKSIPLLSKVTSNISSDYTEEQAREEENQRSLKQNKLAEEQVSWLQDSLMPWLKKFGEKQRLESDGFISTFFPMLASMINASPLLLKLIGFGKLFLGIAGGIFGAVKFVEGIRKSVDILGHEIDFTSLKGWLEALNLGLGNIVSSITGIDLKTVYNWLNNFDKTLENSYKKYLQPIIGSLWKSIKSTLESAYNTVIKPVIDKVNNYFDNFAEKFPAISKAIEDIYSYFKNDIIPFISSLTTEISKSIGKTVNSMYTNIFGNTEDIDWNDFLDTLLSPIETISTSVTELMKYASTVYHMFANSDGITEFFNPDKWEETFKNISESSYYSGNKYADEIKQLNEYNKNYIQMIGDYRKKEREYKNLKLNETFGISREDYDNNKNIWELVKSRMSNKSDIEELNRILENYDLNANLSFQNAYDRDKQILEHYKRVSISAIKSSIAGFRKDIEENEEKIKEYNLLNEQSKFIEAQINRRGISRQEAIKQWNRLQERKNDIESIKSSNLIENNIMSANNQAEIRAEETKPVQPTINANGSGNVINNNNYNNITSNIQSSLNEQQMMESSKNTGM